MWDILRTRLQQGMRTIAYPDAEPALPDRFRGAPLLDASRCPDGCRACIDACPTQALGAEGSELRLDLGRCLFCTDCVEACPEGAIGFGTDWRLATRRREDLVSDGRTRKLAEALDARARRLFGRSLKLRQVSAGGCNACEADVNVLSTVVFDLGRFGIQFVASPRHADGLLITGAVSRNMVLALEKTWAAVPEPKLVIAVGACAISGGPYAGHPEVLNGAEALLPVDLYVPGCPPHPITILDGLLRLLGRIEEARRRTAQPLPDSRRRPFPISRRCVSSPSFEGAGVDLRYVEADEKFRRELRGWLAAEVPKHPKPPPRHDWPARRVHDTGWQRKLFDAGYAGVNWPKAYGGRGATLTEELVYYEETARAHVPYIGMNFVGVRHGGPTVIAEGSELQKKTHLPRILRGEEVWCQGFSEPSAGSDLAALKTTAVRDGDHYVVNGHKIWTSFGQIADYCELLVRTNPSAPKHRGISWMIMPMNLPGIEVRPLPTLQGESDFAEMFLTDVRIPAEQLVGKENDGWRITNVTLRFERGTAWAADIIELKELLSEVAALARKLTRDDATAWEDKALRREVGHLAAEADALWALMKWQLSEIQKTGIPGVGGSTLKLAFTELQQRAYELATRLLGRAGLSREDVGELPAERILTRFLMSLSLTIAAGSSQVQRNIISERILGMPKEPR